MVVFKFSGFDGFCHFQSGLSMESGFHYQLPQFEIPENGIMGG